MTAVNDFGADGVWARHTTTTDWFYTFDPQGCLSQKIGRDGSVLCSSIYDTQGHEATTDTHPDPFSGYGGQWGYYADWETSGDNGGSCLYLLGHRFYDPNAGRFINRDPIGYRGGLNLYGYTGNNPVNAKDPTGYDDEGCGCTIWGGGPPPHPVPAPLPTLPPGFGQSPGRSGGVVFSPGPGSGTITVTGPSQGPQPTPAPTSSSEPCNSVQCVLNGPPIPVEGSPGVVECQYICEDGTGFSIYNNADTPCQAFIPKPENDPFVDPM